MKKFHLIFLIGFFALVSCTPKTSGTTKETFSPELTKAFTDAGLSLLSQKVMPRDFSLPVFTSSSVPETLLRHQSLSGLKGNVVFLNFWATWCVPCRDEIPSIEAIYSKYKDRGLEILAVNSGERATDVSSFMAYYDFSFPIVLDIDGTVSRIYNIQAIPTSYLIDREGNIVFRLIGSIDWNTPEIHTALELLLEQ